MKSLSFQADVAETAVLPNPFSVILVPPFPTHLPSHYVVAEKTWGTWHGAPCGVISGAHALPLLLVPSAWKAGQAAGAPATGLDLRGGGHTVQGMGSGWAPPPMILCSCQTNPREPSSGLLLHEE